MSETFQVKMVFKAVDETAGTFAVTLKGMDRVAAKTQATASAAGTASSSLGTAMEKAGAAATVAATKIQGAGNAATTALGAGSAGVGAFGGRAGDSAEAVRKLGREVESAATRAERGFRRSAQAVEEFQDHVGKVADTTRNVGIGLTAAGAGMVATIYKPVQAFTEMEEVMTRARLPFMKGQGTDPVWNEIQPIIERLGQALPGTNADFGEIAGSMRSAGLAAKDIRDGGLEAAGALKILGRLTNEESGYLSVQMSRALKVEGREFQQFADELQRTSFAAGISIREMATAIPYMGSQLQLFKITGLPGARAVTTAMAMLKDAGISGTEIGSAMAGLLDRLPILQDRLLYGRGWRAREGAALLQRYHLGNLGTQLFSANGELRGDDGLTKMGNIITVFDRINKSITSTKDKAMLFDELLGDIGKRAGVAFTVENWNAARSKILDQAALQTRLNEVLKTQSALWEAAAGTGKIFLATVAEPLAPIIKGATKLVNDLTGKLVDWNRAHPKLTAAIIGTVVVLGTLAIGVGGLLLLAGLLTKGVLAADKGFFELKMVMEMARGSVRGMGRDSLVAAGGIQALAAAQTEAATASAALATAKGSMAKLAGTEAGAAAATRIAAATSAGSAATAALGSAGGGLMATLGGWASGAGSAIAGVVAGITWPVALALAAVVGLIYVYWEPIKAFFKGFGAGFANDFQPVLDCLSVMTDALGGVFRALGSLGAVFGKVQAGSDGVNASFAAGAKVGSFLVGVVHFLAYLLQGLAQGAEAVTVAVVTMVDVIVTAANSLWNVLRGRFGEAKANWSAFSDRFWARLENSSFNAASRPAEAVADAAKLGHASAPQGNPGGGKAAGAPLPPELAKALSEGRSPGGGVQLNYSPKIEMPAGTSKDDEARLLRILEHHKEEVAAMLTKVYERQGRWNSGGK